MRKEISSVKREYFSFSSSSVNKFTYENEEVATNIEMHKPVAKVDSGIEQDAPPKGKFWIYSKLNLNSLQKNYKSNETKSNLSFSQAIARTRVDDTVIWLMGLILKKGGLPYWAMLTKKEIIALAARKDPHYLVQLVSNNKLKIALASGNTYTNSTIFVL